MRVIEITIPVLDPVQSEMLIAFLSDAGYESFREEAGLLSAYIPESAFDLKILHETLEKVNSNLIHSISRQIMEEKNWNEEWEKNFTPVVAGDFYIRAPFHERDTGCRYEIIIEPKMSFGTGHHSTTALMLQLLQETPLVGKSVCDMGCGTGVLAIAAEKLGADAVVAVDNDVWAVANCSENSIANACEKIHIEQGDALALANRKFDRILANINRNILLNDMKKYAESLLPGGRLLISGFYAEDNEALAEEAAKHKLEFVHSRVLNQWSAMVFIKQ